jgi:hypothetical protein
MIDSYTLVNQSMSVINALAILISITQQGAIISLTITT